MSKRCPRCGKYKLVSGFYRNRRQSKGRYSYCKGCWDNRMRAALPQKGCRYRARKYGFSSADEYQAALLKSCEICGKFRPNGVRPGMHIDHDHNTGKIRGTLCTVCNKALGGFGDDPVLLDRAASYLRRYAAAN